ncbi:MAG: GTPase HflX [Candidatus Hydrogenedentes bacterium]|nr:GTPase HflX [Candidatus Hydrogenedentota bacterium]
MIELEQPPITETAVLVRMAHPSDSDEEIDESLEEMRQLLWTAGAEVACTFLQRRDKPCPGTLVGSGKVDEIKAACEELDADLAVFDSDLTPTQGSKLEKLLGLKVVDRTQLILDIFAQRAHTNEGKHQVELAQLQYAMPRLTGRGVEMTQLGGGIGTRGPGEQKLEMDRRVIRKRIDRLRGELDSIRNTRRVQRKKRTESSTATIALVGYTNAGKSSLLNALCGSHAFVENKLFATLDPTSRRCMLPSQREIVLTDTVGFIRKLPHSLVAAFRATLEEVVEADLILVVSDASHPAVDDHTRAVYDVLHEIEAAEKPTIKVYNKVDIADPDRVSALLRNNGRSVAVSAKTGEGLEALLAEIDHQLAPTRSRVTLRIPQSMAGVVSRVRECGRVLSQSYEGNEIILDAEIDRSFENQVLKYIA